jgi:hypothetical protein
MDVLYSWYAVTWFYCVPKPRGCHQNGTAAFGYGCSYLTEHPARGGILDDLVGTSLRIPDTN